MKKVLALVLTLALVASMSVVSFAAVDSRTITGESTVENPLIDVEMPLDLDFKIDAFNLLDPTGVTGQFYSPEYFIIQRAAFNMKAVITMEALATGGVTLTTDSNDINLTDVTDKEKVALVGGIAASSVAVASSGSTATSAVTFGFQPGTNGVVVGTYATFAGTASAATTVRLVDPEKGTGAIGFLLDAAIDTVNATPGVIVPDTLATNGVTSFRLFGEVNAYADWAQHDLDIDFTFDFIPVVLSYHDELKSTGLESEGLQLLNVDETIAAGSVPADGTENNPYIAYAGQTIAFSGITAGTAADVYVKLVGAPSVDAITFAQINPVFVYDASGYEWDKDTQTLHIIQQWGSAGLKPNVVTVGNKSYTLNITVKAPTED